MRGRRIGPYLIEDEIGRGGMGIVYRATQPGLLRTVAVKVLPADLAASSDAVERFQREARAAARLDHPNIVTIHDVGEADGLFYFAMQYIPGITLERLIADRGSIPLAETIRIARQLADALGYAHRKDLIHRDVKPSNIILHQEDRRPLLTDFGIALAATDTRLTESGKIFGSPIYMSPEQLEGKDLDQRSDLYSLGAVIFEMTAGKPPFPGNSAIVVLQNRLRDPDRSLSDLVPDIPPAFDRFVRKLMAIRIEDRFQDAPEVLASLDELQHNGTVEAIYPPPGPGLTAPDTRPSTTPEPHPDTQAIIEPAPRPAIKSAVASPEAEGPSEPKKFQRKLWPWLIPAAVILLLLFWLLPKATGERVSGKAYETTSSREEVTRPPGNTEAKTTLDPVAFLTPPDRAGAEEMPRHTEPTRESPAGTEAIPTTHNPEPEMMGTAAHATEQTPVHRSGLGNHPGEQRIFEVLHNVRMSFVWVPPGSFLMGSPAKEKERQNDEGPAHRVSITRGFWVGQYEVTQAEWEAVMGSNHSTFSGSQRPVENVTWNEAQQFGRRLSRSDAGWVYRLPTEAEWEYCCRAGSMTPFNTGPCLSSSMANCDGRFAYDDCDDGEWRMETTTVGSFSPNAWKLYDMHGNVAEWCDDWYGKTWYSSSPASNPTGPTVGSRRVIRGGSWNQSATRCRSADRQHQPPGFSDENLGFRVVRVRNAQ